MRIADEAWPAHPYDPETGMGIRIEHEVASVAFDGRVVGEARCEKTPKEYWYHLQYLDDFPEKQWWIADLWGGVVHGAVIERSHAVLSGTMNVGGQPATWSVTAGLCPAVSLRWPIPLISPYNFFLRMKLIEFAYGLSAGILAEESRFTILSATDAAGIRYYVHGDSIPWRPQGAPIILSKWYMMHVGKMRVRGGKRDNG